MSELGVIGGLAGRKLRRPFFPGTLLADIDPTACDVRFVPSTDVTEQAPTL
jgi:hypothetical protein